MNRFFVPIAVAAMVSGLGVGLVVGIIARSPETHANVHPEGYDRTPLFYLGEPATFDGLGLADPEPLTTADDPVERGRLIFFGAGCVTCHGLDDRGGIVGPRLDVGDLTVTDLRQATRTGPQGMPIFDEEQLSDGDLESLYAYLQAIGRDGSSSVLYLPNPIR